MKKIILTTVQILITVGLLFWIFHDPAKRELMLHALRGANFIWLLPGFAVVGMGVLLQAKRWHMLLAAQGIVISWGRTVRLMLIGMFFNLFLLGATGGDVIKIFYIMREAAGTKKSGAFLSVVVDRMVGLVALAFVATLFCVLGLDSLLSHPLTRTLFGTLVLILGSSVAVIFGGFLVDRFHLAHKLPHWLPLHGKIVEVASAFSIYARNYKVLVGTFLISIVSHLLLFLSYYFAARAFGAFSGPGGLMQLFSVLPIIMTIAALPISLSGVGVREGLFQKTLPLLFGISEGTAVLISITSFLFVVAWGLIGGVVYLFYRPTGVHLSEMEHEVAELEEKIENEA